VYNDGVFSAEDWKGIKSIYTSVKEKDALKVGRFGLGFKSIFHITGKTLAYDNRIYLSLCSKNGKEPRKLQYNWMC
jgi:hypothetical protein